MDSPLFSVGDTDAHRSRRTRPCTTGPVRTSRVRWGHLECSIWQQRVQRRGQRLSCTCAVPRHSTLKPPPLPTSCFRYTRTPIPSLVTTFLSRCPTPAPFLTVANLSLLLYRSLCHHTLSTQVVTRAVAPGAALPVRGIHGCTSVCVHPAGMNAAVVSLLTAVTTNPPCENLLLGLRLLALP